MNRIKVFVVEDSAVTRDFLVYVFNEDPGLEVVGTAKNGTEALRFLESNKVDVITMDIHMPVMNGFETTRRIMETFPTPVVIVTASTQNHEVATLFKAVDAGALAVQRLPAGLGHPKHSETSGELIRTIKLMSEVKVVRRWARARNSKTISSPSSPEFAESQNAIQIVAIGASTGGPTVLQSILSRLPKNFPAPIVIVQHIAPGFVGGFVEWLASTSGIPTKVALHGEILSPGQVYLAPDGYQMLVGSNRSISLRNDPPQNGLRPSVSSLFHSVAVNYGKNAVGILLTGMGKDGAEELGLIRKMGGTTIAQNKSSCVVDGMPAAAIKIDAAQHILSPEEIADALKALTAMKGQRSP